MADLSAGLAADVLSRSDHTYHDDLDVFADIYGTDDMVIVTLKDASTNEERTYRFLGEEV